MKNELRKGYRLTREEEAIMRGETPEVPDKPVPSPAQAKDLEPTPEKKPKKGSGRALKAILPLLLAFGLMISIAYLFMWLVNTPERRARQAEQEGRGLTEESVYTVSAAEKALYTAELSLSEEESPAFFQLYTHFMQELQSIRARHSQWTETEVESEDPEKVFSQQKEIYLSHYEKLKEVETRYMDAFALLIGRERAIVFLRIYARQSPENPVHMP